MEEEGGGRGGEGRINKEGWKEMRWEARRVGMFKNLVGFQRGKRIAKMFI